MKKSILFLLMAVVLLQTQLFAQENNPKRLDNYKYVIVPIQFPFQKTPNQFQFNTAIRHLLVEENFTVLMDVEEYPDELAFNRCLALYADVVNISEGMFSMHTELEVLLRNCKNQIVFRTKVGKSRTKDVGQSLKEALIDAFLSFRGVHYKYNGNAGFEDDSVYADKHSSGETAAKTPLSITLGKEYIFEGQIYEVNEIEAGYLLIEQATQNRIALFNITKGNNVLYNSKDINGTAIIEKDGSAINIDYYDADSASVKRIVYEQKP